MKTDETNLETWKGHYTTIKHPVETKLLKMRETIQTKTKTAGRCWTIVLTSRLLKLMFLIFDCSGGWGSWSPLWMCGPSLAKSTVGMISFRKVQIQG